MARLFLHAGHPKTGSSWIQSCLRLNQAALLERGIRYATGDDAGVTDPLRITSGNGYGLLKSEANLEQALASNPLSGRRGLLFSSEFFPADFLEARAETFLDAVTERHGFDEICVLLFVRNPIGLAISSWTQQVKREGWYKGTLEDFCQNPKNFSKNIEHVHEFCKRLALCRRVVLTIRNYSYCAENLMDEMADWLAIPAEIFSIKPPAKVNRALTWSELRFQNALNAQLGRSGRLLSDPLCEQLPDIEPERYAPSLATQSAIWAHLHPMLTELNTRIPEAHRYQFDALTADPLPGDLAFTEEQIRVISAALGEEIRRLRGQVDHAEQRIESLRRSNEALRARLPEPHLLRRLGRKFWRAVSRLWRR